MASLHGRPFPGKIKHKLLTAFDKLQILLAPQVLQKGKHIKGKGCRSESGNWSNTPGLIYEIQVVSLLVPVHCSAALYLPLIQTKGAVASGLSHLVVGG